MSTLQAMRPRIRPSPRLYRQFTQTPRSEDPRSSRLSSPDPPTLWTRDLSVFPIKSPAHLVPFAPPPIVPESVTALIYLCKAVTLLTAVSQSHGGTSGLLNFAAHHTANAASAAASAADTLSLLSLSRAQHCICSAILNIVQLSTSICVDPLALQGVYCCLISAFVTMQRLRELREPLRRTSGATDVSSPMVDALLFHGSCRLFVAAEDVAVALPAIAQTMRSSAVVALAEAMPALLNISMPGRNPFHTVSETAFTAEDVAESRSLVLCGLHLLLPLMSPPHLPVTYLGDAFARLLSSASEALTEASVCRRLVEGSPLRDPLCDRAIRKLRTLLVVSHSRALVRKPGIFGNALLLSAYSGRPLGTTSLRPRWQPRRRYSPWLNIPIPSKDEITAAVTDARDAQRRAIPRNTKVPLPRCRFTGDPKLPAGAVFIPQRFLLPGVRLNAARFTPAISSGVLQQDKAATTHVRYRDVYEELEHAKQVIASRVVHRSARLTPRAVPCSALLQGLPVGADVLATDSEDLIQHEVAEWFAASSYSVSPESFPLFRPHPHEEASWRLLVRKATHPSQRDISQPHFDAYVALLDLTSVDRLANRLQRFAAPCRLRYKFFNRDHDERVAATATSKKVSRSTIAAAGVVQTAAAVCGEAAGDEEAHTIAAAGVVQTAAAVCGEAAGDEEAHTIAAAGVVQTAAAVCGEAAGDEEAHTIAAAGVVQTSPPAEPALFSVVCDAAPEPSIVPSFCSPQPPSVVPSAGSSTFHEVGLVNLTRNVALVFGSQTSNSVSRPSLASRRTACRNHEFRTLPPEILALRNRALAIITSLPRVVSEPLALIREYRGWLRRRRPDPPRCIQF